MGRGKVKLAFIENKANRKATYKKRKKGLLKMVSEISTLCGVDACVIICSPDDPEPLAWPSNLGVQRVFALFKRSPGKDQPRKMFDQETYLQERIAKINKKIKKLLMENRENEFTELIQNLLSDRRGLHTLPLTTLRELGYRVEQKLKEIDRRIEATGSIAALHQVAPPPPLLPPLLQPQMPTQADTMQVQEQFSRPPWVNDFLNEPDENLGIWSRMGGSKHI